MLNVPGNRATDHLIAVEEQSHHRPIISSCDKVKGSIIGDGRGTKYLIGNSTNIQEEARRTEWYTARGRLEEERGCGIHCNGQDVAPDKVVKLRDNYVGISDLKRASREDGLDPTVNGNLLRGQQACARWDSNRIAPIKVEGLTDFA